MFWIKSALFKKSDRSSAEQSHSNSVASPFSYIYLIRVFILAYCSASFASAISNDSSVLWISPLVIATCISMVEISSLIETISWLIPASWLSSSEVLLSRLSESSAYAGKRESVSTRQHMRQIPVSRLCFECNSIFLIPFWVSFFHELNLYASYYTINCVVRQILIKYVIDF